MQQQVEPFLCVCIALLVLTLSGLVVLSIVESYSRWRASVSQLADANEDFRIRVRLIYSNQQQSQQPIIAFESQSVKLFAQVNPQQQEDWKWWVKHNYPFGPFPLYIDGNLEL